MLESFGDAMLKGKPLFLAVALFATSPALAQCEDHGLWEPQVNQIRDAISASDKAKFYTVKDDLPKWLKAINEEPPATELAAQELGVTELGDGMALIGAREGECVAWVLKVPASQWRHIKNKVVGEPL